MSRPIVLSDADRAGDLDDDGQLDERSDEEDQDEDECHASVGPAGVGGCTGEPGDAVWCVGRLSSQPTAGPGSARWRSRWSCAGHTSGDVTLFTSDLRSGNMRRTTQEPRGFLVRRGWSDAIDKGGAMAPPGPRGYGMSRGVARRIAPATPPRRRLRRAPVDAHATAPKTTDAAPPPLGVDAASVPCSSAAASCAAPARLCARPRSDLPRYREAHGCAVRSRDTALAPAHVAQMALACSSRSSFSLLRSKCDGGKKTAACGPRHAARTCQSSSTRCALTDTPPFRGGPYCRSLTRIQGKVPAVSADGNPGDIPGQRGCERRVTTTCGSYDPRCRRHEMPARRTSACRRRNVTRRTAPAPDSHGRRLPRARPRGRGPRWRPRAPARPCESGWPGWCGPATARRGA